MSAPTRRSGAPVQPGSPSAATAPSGSTALSVSAGRSSVESAGGGASAGSSRADSAASAPASPSSSAEGAPRSPPPFYDENADEEDAAWARRKLGPAGTRLSCPGCFALLCTRAQPHVQYDGQFRAVFVRNVEVNDASTLRASVESPSSVDAQATGAIASRTSERFRPVCCRRCRTDVAVLDEDDVYHFCNVLH